MLWPVFVWIFLSARVPVGHNVHFLQLPCWFLLRFWDHRCTSVQCRVLRIIGRPDGTHLLWHVYLRILLSARVRVRHDVHFLQLPGWILLRSGFNRSTAVRGGLLRFRGGAFVANMYRLVRWVRQRERGATGRGCEHAGMSRWFLLRTGGARCVPLFVWVLWVFIGPDVCDMFWCL